MKQTTDKTRKIIYWTMFGCATLILIAALVVRLVGIIKKVDLLIHLSPIFSSCSVLVNVIDTLAFKPNSKKLKKGEEEPAVEQDEEKQ